MEFGGPTEELTGLVTSLAADARPPRGLVLEVEDAGAPGTKRRRAIGLVVVVGAGRECDLVLVDRKVSRIHAEVRAATGGVVVVDRDSRNGTRVNDALVKEAFVPVGGHFVLGASRARVVDDGLPRLPPSTRTRFGGLVGESVVMREVFAVLERAADAPATVLLEGPSGTGKELAARALHDHSRRARARFVAFDCSVVSRDLLPSALFGHRKGAFTSAVADRAGAFVEAHGGTLFLDEIGELPPDGQAQLLRVLETRQLTAVGDDKPRAVDVRVVAATHRDLFQMVQDGRFRLDLLHRLAVVHVRLPALAHHREDIPALVAALYEGRGLAPGPIDGDNLARLHAHPFDGNVRELRNILDRSLALAPPEAQHFRDLLLWLGPTSSTPPATTLAPTSTTALRAGATAAPSEDDGALVDVTLPYKDAKEQMLARFDALYLPRLMARFDDNLTRAAAHAGLSRRHLRVLLQKAGLRSAADEGPEGRDGA
jgi:DNA-binding NtrC family response regulator